MATEEAGPAPVDVPTCYRHPGRETYIRCNRCDRPICPDCMIPASVGFQCPECVREGSRSVREARTVFGGRVSDNPGWVSRAIVAGTVLVYLLQQVPELRIVDRLALTAYYPPYDDPLGVVAGDWYRLGTVALVHSGIFHLLLNMYALWVFGPPLEAALGRVRFALLYVVSALGGSAASYAFNDVGTVGVGASGAIFGLFAAHLVISRRVGRDASQLWVLLAINVAAGFLIPRIDWRAHVGGLVVGAALTAIYAYAPRARRTTVHVVGALVVTALVLGAVGARTAQLDSRLERCQDTVPDFAVSVVLNCLDSA
jgi:membrane associated rhomboid family serine protease